MSKSQNNSTKISPKEWSEFAIRWAELYEQFADIKSRFTTIIKVIKNPILKAALEKVLLDIMQTGTIIEAFEREPVFPPEFIVALREAQEDGRFSERLLIFAKYKRIETELDLVCRSFPEG